MVRIGTSASWIFFRTSSTVLSSSSAERISPILFADALMALTIFSPSKDCFVPSFLIT